VYSKEDKRVNSERKKRVKLNLGRESQVAIINDLGDIYLKNKKPWFP
jgi:hypothetical protein